MGRMCFHERDVIQERYWTNEPLFCAFCLARVAGTLLSSHGKRAESTLEQASAVLSEKVITKDTELATRAVLSYVERSIGSYNMMQHLWSKSVSALERALQHWPSNSSAYYGLGCYYMADALYEDAIWCMRRAIVLDPDGKHSYMALSNCHLLLRNYQDAVAVAKTCLARRPALQSAQFIIGTAIYNMVWDGSVAEATLSETCERGRAALMEAKKGMLYLSNVKKNVRYQWLQADDLMLAYLSAEAEERQSHSRQPLRTLAVSGWLP